MLTAVVVIAKYGVQKGLLIKAIFFTTPSRVMSHLISGMLEPQLVPALSRAPMSVAVAQPDWIASTFAASPTPKRAQTWLPMLRLHLGGIQGRRPATGSCPSGTALQIFRR
jgi:hypothetical protein